MTRSPLSRKAGLAVRRLRLAKGWTLLTLSRRTGVPLSTLSKLELGQSTLTHDKWVLLCRALDAEPADEILRGMDGSSSAAASGRRCVRRHGEGERVEAAGYVFTATAQDLVGKSFSPMIVEFGARTISEHGPMRRTTGELFVHMIDGRATLHCEGYTPLALAPGDSVYFDGARDHALLAAEPPARALVVLAGDKPDWR